MSDGLGAILEAHHDGLYVNDVIHLPEPYRLGP
jgi:hypothetical protein